MKFTQQSLVTLYRDGTAMGISIPVMAESIGIAPSVFKPMAELEVLAPQVLDEIEKGNHIKFESGQITNDLDVIVCEAVRVKGFSSTFFEGIHFPYG